MKSAVVAQPTACNEDSFHVVELDDVADALQLASKLEYGDLPGAVLADSAVRIAELKAQLEALEAEIVAAYDASGDWAVSGHRTVGAALSHRTRVRRSEANQTVHLARTLRAMPVVADAFGRGEIKLCHARRLAKASVRDGFSDAETLLCNQACTLSYRAFDKAVSYWEHLVDADAAEHDATFKEQRREFHASMTFDGMGRLDGWLDPIGFEEFRNALERIEAELFNNDLKDAQADHIDRHTAELWRTPAQRRADALVEMARRATAVPEGAKTPEPLVIIHMDKPTFEEGLNGTLGLNLFNHEPAQADRGPLSAEAGRLCETDSGAVITPTQAVEQALRGHIRRLVYESPGVILDYGRSTRLFTGALRQAIQARDRTCSHTGCDLPARLCEIDHITEWQHGGTTTHTNAATRCSYHHRHHKPPI
ncbi:MAG: DUF222 domain-containing protein [Acidimicrobiaceae bacterium]|nr:DUF222 domain-containing protein [Acidimicrobiaceae bacterium]MYG54524.1 DUF222 domain-containing protein [Acidimicrobiaceae bacterium]MYJ99443.1 DUF222 domain-containing protein [Acidimicrobiaceae bacterium]